METLLIISFALSSMAFIAYVFYDLKLAPQDSPGATIPKPKFSDAGQGQWLSPEDAAHRSLELIYRQVNHWDWQQAVANVIASLTVSGNAPLVEPRHSFPRHMVLGESNHALRPQDLHAAVANYQKTTGRAEQAIWLDIQNQFKSFLETRDSLREPQNTQGSVSTPVELRPRLRETIQTVRAKYPFFNGSEPLHEDRLKEIFEAEEIDLLFVDELPLLSLFVEFPDPNRKRKFCVVIRNDVHQALREFLLAHELGHWFLHFESGFAERFIGENYYLHSSLEWYPLEFDADTFAMTALFPTPYLAYREVYEGSLSDENLLADFTQGMDNVEEGHLRDNVLKYIRARLGHYRHFKQTILPVRIQVASVQEADVDTLLRLSQGPSSESSVNWVQMDANFTITRASESFLKLFGLPAEDVINKKTPIDLVVPEEKEALNRLFQHRRDKLKEVFYFTWIISSGNQGGRRIAVHSLPILRDSEYVGSIGYLILPEEISPEAFTPNAIHTN
jgi:PAS domain S-box-containing protein